MLRILITDRIHGYATVGIISLSPDTRIPTPLISTIIKKNR